MSNGEINITVVGNLTADPELRFTPTGRAVAKFSVAANTRYRDGQGQWQNGKTSYPICIAWGAMAENVAESFQRGQRVIVVGKFEQRQFETPEGKKGSVWELQVEAIGPDVRYGTAKFNKMDRASTSAGAVPAGGSDDDPWATEPGF